MSSFNVGETIIWMSARGFKSGVIEDIRNDDYIVRLSSGKYICVSTPERVEKSKTTRKF